MRRLLTVSNDRTSSDLQRLRAAILDHKLPKHELKHRRRDSVRSLAPQRSARAMRRWAPPRTHRCPGRLRPSPLARHECQPAPRAQPWDARALDWNCIDHRKTGAHCALGVIVVRLRIAEIDLSIVKTKSERIDDGAHRGSASLRSHRLSVSIESRERLCLATDGCGSRCSRRRKL